MYTCSREPRPSSLAIRSPRESIAADMAETRSSSTPWGSALASGSPSTLTMAEASISGEDACSSRRRSTISWLRVLVKVALLCGGCPQFDLLHLETELDTTLTQAFVRVNQRISRIMG